jgi:hypothetical protein
MRCTSRHVLAGLLFLAVTVQGGCDRPIDPPPPHSPHRYVPQSSAAYCLNNLRQAYVDRDIDEYLKLFSEDFTFIFNPQDVANPVNPTPPQWGLADERDSAENMFTSELVESISLTFDQDPAIQSDSEYVGTWKVLMRNVRLQVNTRKDDGSRLTLLLENGRETFHFKEYPHEQATDGHNLWRIWRWMDEPIGTEAGAKVKQISWGRIKSRYQ